ncbi:CAP domain-containing protein [Alkalihalobacillus sp. MEB130]|uniref:CAP domain-containing protein n=1 Tax=Alkalihalobacillus sp. MEB130 TaxID=2976704 RepID=UPI0028DFEA29|nr:CAP domain-containing protein [Alkalihalobacillus sp. MEB130]MDT8862183.1 CAP domain-containing protein [Alkalihalobacillus sp. MEB130]
MKKLLVTASLATALLATNFSGQVDASEHVQVKTIHVNEFNQETLDWYKEIYESYVRQFKQLQQNPNNVEQEKSFEEVQPEVHNEREVINPSVEEVQKEVTQEEQQMVDLVNQERAQRGLAPLQINEQLTEVARVKAQDMIDHQYFSHQSPTYGSPFDMLTQFDVSYRTAGENLAGNQTVEAAHQALMNSDGHRANILNADYGEVGIGIIEGGPYGKMFVQLFKD